MIAKFKRSKRVGGGSDNRAEECNQVNEATPRPPKDSCEPEAVGDAKTEAKIKLDELEIYTAKTGVLININVLVYFSQMMD